MLVSMGHTGLVIKDMDAAKAFYRDVLGLEVRREGERTGEMIAHLLNLPDAHLKVCHLGMPGEPTIELLQYVNPAGGDRHGEKNLIGMGHIAFQVTGLDEMITALTEKGCRFANTPWVAEQPDGGTTKSCYLQDPEGNWLEFSERLPPP